MKILVINSWSSSLKYEIFDMKSKKSLAKWTIERIWLEKSIITHKKDNKKIEKIQNIKDHEQALQEALSFLLSAENKIISKLSDIDAIWHRIVHWWENFAKPTIIDKKVLNELEKISDLAPLHNPANIKWIIACKDLLWKIPQVWVFDTAFHQSMEKENYLYAIPYSYYKKHKIRKYWFHWTSHQYVSQRACEILKIKLEKQKIITCHIWNGVSITAIKNWKVIDTSMWMTPLAWLMMGTRSGDIDPAIVSIIAKKEKTEVDNVDTILNKESWLLWITWFADMRENIKWEINWDENCKLAINMYINKIVKYIWSYITILWWLDLLVFTAGIWENSPIIRKKIAEKLKFFDIKLSKKNDKVIWQEEIISHKNSKIKILVVPTKEELMIAKETFKILKK